MFAGNSGISLVDVGDGIGCFELHSKMNALGEDIVSFLLKHLRAGSDAVKNFDGFVISTDAQNFLRWREPDAVAAGGAGW